MSFTYVDEHGFTSDVKIAVQVDIADLRKHMKQFLGKRVRIGDQHYIIDGANMYITEDDDDPHYLTDVKCLGCA